MQKLKVDGKEYQLEMSFNSVLDTDAMNQLTESRNLSNQIASFNKYRKEVEKAEKNNENIPEMPKNIKDFDMMATVMKLLRIERSLLYDCLIEHHGDEIKDEKECGSLIQRALASKEYDIMGILGLITQCVDESDFLSGKRPEKTRAIKVLKEQSSTTNTTM